MTVLIVTGAGVRQAQAQGGYRGMSPENDPLLRLWADQRAKQTRSSVGVLQVSIGLLLMRDAVVLLLYCPVFTERSVALSSIS